MEFLCGLNRTFGIVLVGRNLQHHRVDGLKIKKHVTLISNQKPGEQLQNFQHVLQPRYILLPILRLESCLPLFWFYGTSAEPAPLSSAVCLHRDYIARGGETRR